MKTLLKNHCYVNIRKPKETRYIGSIIAMDDREVPDAMFNDFKDITISPVVEIIEGGLRNRLEDIFKITGADQ